MPQLDLRQHPLQRDVSKVVTYLEPHPAPGTQDQPASPISRTPLRQRKRAGVRLKHSLDHRDWEGLHWKPRGTLQSDSVAPTPGPHSIERRGSPPPPRLSVSPVGKREPKEPFPTLGTHFQRGPFGFRLPQRDHLGSQQGTTTLTESAELQQLALRHRQTAFPCARPRAEIAVTVLPVWPGNTVVWQF